MANKFFDLSFPFLNPNLLSNFEYSLFHWCGIIQNNYIQGMRYVAGVQRMHKPVHLWDITFYTRRFWGSKYLLLVHHPQLLKPRALFYRTDCTRRSKFLTHALNYFSIFPSWTMNIWTASDINLPPCGLTND